MKTLLRTPQDLLCYGTTMGLIILALAFAFHSDPDATTRAIDAAKAIVGSVEASTPTPAPTP